MTAHALTISQCIGAALVDAGGRFMTGVEMEAEARPLGLQAGALYLRGRAGALGEVTPDVAAAVIGIFPDWVIELTWRESVALSAGAAVHAYSASCRRWARQHLTSLSGAARLSILAEEVIDCAEASALPLFAAWRAQPRPEQPAERAGHALAVLRELRGGLHFAALRSHGLDIPIAVLGDPRGGVPRLMRTAWQLEDIENLQRRAVLIRDLSQRWSAAERDTDAVFAGQLDVLTESELTELAELIEKADLLSRPPPAQPPQDPAAAG